MNDHDTTIATIKERIDAFKAERGWGKHNNSNQLAMSICIEAAELLECFQWGDFSKSTKDDWAEELADIMVYCLQFGSINGIDIAAAIEKKMAKNATKYPVSIFNAENNSLDAYWAIKKQHRGEK